MQELITRELGEMLPRLYATEDEEVPTALAHLYAVWTDWDWYVVEYDPVERVAFGLVKGFETEWGYFSVAEMEDMNRGAGFEVIERDEHFRPQPASDFER